MYETVFLTSLLFNMEIVQTFHWQMNTISQSKGRQGMLNKVEITKAWEVSRAARKAFPPFL